ncbi:3-isopropylmalate dehydratase small subunit [Desulfogranum japonicum]|uniref:3-isopropylmalate dehydratase small subunit n=1 Tax=Desulfogranum japonicum TaxID=231447 RepID=UPI00041874DA|nr:3-isopropylmalate dehydratase [Desulfogranum japonicum]
MKNFSGKVLFLDRDDINTDEIIPARYLTENSKEALQPYLLEDLEMTGFDPRQDIAGKAAIVTRDNFGCGSSREHAPWALEVNNINIVIGVGFARIFRQNMYNCGLMAVQLPSDTIEQLFARFAGKDTTVTTDFEKRKLVFSAGDQVEELEFELGGFDKALVEAGGWIGYADEKY